jgi:SAM-dependent MidA family methyltransferase
MAEALYHPQYGYFSTGGLRSVKGGDFLTSPEVSPAFGEALSRFVRDEEERVGSPFRLVEVGAGSGSLLSSLLAAHPVEAWAVEASPAAQVALGELLTPERVVARFDMIPQPFPGVVIANELIDNLPMSLATRTIDGWSELWVGSDRGELTLVEAEPRQQILDWLDRFAGPVVEGGVVEVQIAAAEWMVGTLQALTAGAVVVIDYGDTADNLVPRRGDGTLRTYRSHHLGPHPLSEPGAIDITADVNFTTLIAAAEESGARVEYVRQDEFLASLGLRKRLSDLRHLELTMAREGESMERLQVRSLISEIETLVHPRGLGDFRVLVARK